ncbi:hypothetical protein CRUP_024051 [Coryphaenoides rupestris]|nr:hypothetical protein CRUP_024051 [Coryphaenoides rupestris]
MTEVSRVLLQVSLLAIAAASFARPCSCEPIQCDAAYKPLCGKDGRTYANDCERRKAECMSKNHIPVKQQGPCACRGGGRVTSSEYCPTPTGAPESLVLMAARCFAPGPVALKGEVCQPSSLN